MEKINPAKPPKPVEQKGYKSAIDPSKEIVSRPVFGNGNTEDILMQAKKANEQSQAQKANVKLGAHNRIPQQSAPQKPNFVPNTDNPSKGKMKFAGQGLLDLDKIWLEDQKKQDEFRRQMSEMGMGNKQPVKAKAQKKQQQEENLFKLLMGSGYGRDVALMKKMGVPNAEILGIFSQVLNHLTGRIIG